MYRKIRYPQDTDDDNRRAGTQRPVSNQKKRQGKDLCGKRRFENEFEAGKHLKKAQAWAKKNGFKVPQRFYYHKRCRGYHITSQEAKDEAA
ncbi:MAG TPA: hypothetical protein VGR89_11070 [Puia sp.]|nr:hypothetical protein [Puia sp.]